MRVTQSITVEQRGIGKPDYSREISSGRTRPGISLKENQELGIAGIAAAPIISPYPWVRAPIAAGDSAHFIDWTTGLPTPYLLAQGYTLTIVQTTGSFDQDNSVMIYIDGFFVAHFGNSAGGIIFGRQDIIGFSSAIFDPTAASPHQIDAVLNNIGGDAMQGSTSMVLILEKVGSPPLPSTKTVRCKFCGHEWSVPREVTSINCPKCGQLNIYCDFSKLRSF